MILYKKLNKFWKMINFNKKSNRKLKIVFNIYKIIVISILIVEK